MANHLTLKEKKKRREELHEKRNEEMTEETIKIYPSNWLYNAGVIGFLKVLENSGEKVEELLKDDGTVEIKRQLFERINCDEMYFSENKVSSIVGKSLLYRNYIQSGWKDGFKEFVKEMSHVEEINKCSLCGGGWLLSEDRKNRLVQTYQYMEKFFDGIERFAMRSNALLGPSEGEFPNAFWNLNSSFPVCHLCAYLMIHHHIPFESAKTQDGQIFINAPSFKMMWYLNKYASEILNKRRSYQLKQILGISFMELAQKVFTTISVWSMMNIEMVIESYNKVKKKMEIDYYSLPYNISRLLLNKNIASLISETKEDYILEIVLNGRFDSLLTLNHKVIRYIVTNSDPDKDKSLSRLKRKDNQNLKNLSQILPELYVKIDSILKER